MTTDDQTAMEEEKPSESVLLGALQSGEGQLKEASDQGTDAKAGGKEIEAIDHDEKPKMMEVEDGAHVEFSSETYELPEESRKAKERQEQLLQELELKRRARLLAVPTNDNAVREKLRALDEPITLFGEREMERRDRLRQLMAKLDATGELEKLLAVEDESEAEEEEEAPKAELFYTEGTAELLQARSSIAKYSLLRAAERLATAKRRRQDPDEDEEAEAAEVLRGVAEMSMECSEIGDDRPISDCSISPDGSLLATSCWSMRTSIWRLPGVSKTTSFQACTQRHLLINGHTERVTSVAFHPKSCIDQSPSAGNVATASADRNAILWSLEGKQLQTYDGHIDRLARLAFHPSGLYLGTASFDKTWRLWDVETGAELLLQEGHSRSVYGIAFNRDGSLAASCGLDALARVWDLRTGRSILAFEGHVKPVLAVDFSPNGYHLATGGEDNMCRIWDMRKRQCLYTIPAHLALISQLKYEPQDGHFLVTASYDNLARVWSGRDFKPVKTLAGHESKVMGVDIAPDGSFITTVSYDRTIKLWSHDSGSLGAPMHTA
eukprot:jgi/Mesen1/4667/ME000241S03704